MQRKIEEELKRWKEQKEGRKPLLLYGARQVGKTYALLSFGENCYTKTVYLNLETNPQAAAAFAGDLSPKALVPVLETIAQEEITAGDTLLVLDEVQASERALTSLKYFCEQMPGLHVAAAGSLLGVALHREQYSFPVGKVMTKTLYPMDYEEFLWALGEERLAEQIRKSCAGMEKLSEALHQRALELYRAYLIVGGMPEVVRAYAETGKLLLIPQLQHDIIGSYVADMAKYASESETVKIRACFRSVPTQLAKENHKFMYRVVQRGGSSALFGASIEWLLQSGVAIACRRTEKGEDPVSAYADLSAFKLYLGDVGLLTAMSGLSQQTVLLETGNTFMGALTENYAAQQLVSRGCELYYWAPANSQAELDFVLQKDGVIAAIACKRKRNAHSRSLGMFIEHYHPDRAIRFSEENFYRTETVDAVPLYAAFCVPLSRR